MITFATSAGFPNWLGRSADSGKTWKRVASSTRSDDWNSLSYVNRKAGWVMLGGSYRLRTSDAALGLASGELLNGQRRCSEKRALGVRGSDPHTDQQAVHSWNAQ